MQNRAPFLAAALLVGLTQLPPAYSRALRTAHATAEFQISEQQPGADLTRRFEQRSLYRECLLTADFAQKHMDEFVGNVKRGAWKQDEIQLHLREIRVAVDRMVQDHDIFIKSLNEQQWNASKDRIAKLEMLRAETTAKLQGIDLELQMPTPQSKVLTKYGNTVEKQLKEWQKLHRKVAAVTGIERYP